jgi:hypothetical protein
MPPKETTMNYYSNMPPHEFAKVPSVQLQNELHAAHAALNAALERRPEEIDLDEVRAGCNAVATAAAALRRKHHC